MYMKDSDGKKSFTVTMSIITFAVVMLKVLVGGTSFTIGGVSMAFGNIGSDEIMALLGPTLGAYSFRRYTDRRYGQEDYTADPPGEEASEDPRTV
jgi:hypothetical protein